MQRLDEAGVYIRTSLSSALNLQGSRHYAMELELHPAVTLPPRSFCTLIAPEGVLVGALNSRINLQRFKILYVCGNYSRILSRMDRNFVDLEIRRAFTAFQLLTILKEARHTVVFVEHDPSLYEDAEEIPEYISQALRDLPTERLWCLRPIG